MLGSRRATRALTSAGAVAVWAIALAPLAPAQEPRSGPDEHQDDARALERRYRAARQRYERLLAEVDRLRRELRPLERRLGELEDEYRRLRNQAAGVVRDERLAGVRRQQRAVAGEVAPLQLALEAALDSLALARWDLAAAGPPKAERLFEQARRLSEQKRDVQAAEVFEEAMRIERETSDLETGLLRDEAHEAPPALEVDPAAPPKRLRKELGSYRAAAGDAARQATRWRQIEAALAARVERQQRWVERGTVRRIQGDEGEQHLSLEQRLATERRKLERVRGRREQAEAKAAAYRQHAAALERALQGP